MLNEAYAPTCFADLAWSRQKSTALSTFIRHLRSSSSSSSGGGAGGSKDSAAGSQSPRILLLYGPAGCGKLSSLQVLLREDVPPAATSRPASAAPFTPTLTPTQSHVFHTCEATVQAYAQFLQQTIAHCSGQLLGTALELSSSATAPQASQRRDADSPAHHAHIVKFYGEPASHALHRCTLLFVRQYEELCAQAMMQQQQQQQARLSGGSAAASQPSLLEQLRRNPVFFIHTTHDTHNDKVDINTSFPAAVLQSTAVELFHCTAITEINLKKRLKQVLEQEAVRRAQRRAQTEKCVDVDEMDTAVVCSAVSGKRAKAAARGGGGRGGTAKGRKLSVSASYAASAAANQKGSRTAAVAPSHMSFLDVIDGAALDAIAAGSQGDIRQALLQIQWTALLPPEGESGAALRSAASPSSLAHQAASQIWDRLRERRRLRECVATAGPSPCPPAPGESKAPVDDAVSPGPTQDSTVSGDEDVILISSSSSSSSSDVSAVSASPSPSLGMTAEVVSSGGKEASPSRRSAETSRKRARSPPAVTDMLSLLDAQMSTADLLSTTPTPSAAKTGRSGSTTAAAVEHRSVLPTTRDEYLGLSHATGRLLSQKYDINEVLDILNVAPRKMLDYLTNSQIRFFRDTQLPQYSACAAAASDTDALRVSDYGSGGGGGATGVSAAALRERRQLADRTAAGDSVGNVARLLDVVALHIFHGTHLVKQTDVFVPSTFVPMEPPPFLRSAYPRLRDVAVPSNTGRAAREDAGVAESEFSEQEWTQRFLLRLDGASTPSAGRAGPLGGRARTGGGLYGAPSFAAFATSPRIQMDEVDIAREGLPDLLCRCGCTDSAVMDYLALAPYIVLTLEPPYTTAAPPPSSLSGAKLSATQSLQKVKGELGFIHSLPVKQEGVAAALANSAASADSKPRRTVFKFAAASTSSQSGGSPAVSSSSSPSSLPAPSTMPHRVPSHRPCTVLQFKILQRGRDESKAALRADKFVLVAAEDTAAEGAMDATGGVEERPWMPDGEDIEDD